MREPEIAAERAVDGVAVVAADGVGVTARRNRVGRPHAGLHRLRDSFAGQRIDDGRGIAGVEHRTVHESRR